MEPLAAQRLAAFELAETRKQKRPGQEPGRTFFLSWLAIFP